MSIITVIAKITLDPAFDDAFRQLLDNILHASAAEEGNLGYSAFTAYSEENQYLFLEKWTSMAAFEAHQREPHFIQFVDFLTQKKAGLEIEVHSM